LKESYQEWIKFGEKLLLLKEKAIWIEEKQALIIADTHFGKAGHFRKAGVPIPENIHRKDFDRLGKLIEQWQAKAVYFLGDLFHSDYNADWLKLTQFIYAYSDIDFHLVKGNHDILSKPVYRTSALIIHEKTIEVSNMLLTHEPLESGTGEQLNICGHLHPGVTLNGKGRQRIKMPCFHYRSNCLIMPAFGSFTGLMNQGIEIGDEIYAVTSEKVIPIKLKNKVG
jgi:uncharacterized protein